MWLQLAYCLLVVTVSFVRAGPRQVPATSAKFSSGWVDDHTWSCGNSWPTIWTLTLGMGANFTFTGTAIDVYGLYSSRGGLSTILLDGVAVGSFNSLPPLQATCQAHIFSKSGLPLGEHTIAIFFTQYGPDNVRGEVGLSHFVYDDPSVPGVFTSSSPLLVPTLTPFTTSLPATSTLTLSSPSILNSTTENIGIVASKTSQSASVVTVTYVPSADAAGAQTPSPLHPRASVIIGAMIGSILGVAALGFVIWWVWIRKPPPPFLMTYNPDPTPREPPKEEFPPPTPRRVFRNAPWRESMTGEGVERYDPQNTGPVGETPRIHEVA